MPSPPPFAALLSSLSAAQSAAIHPLFAMLTAVISELSYLRTELDRSHSRHDRLESLLEISLLQKPPSLPGSPEIITQPPDVSPVKQEPVSVTVPTSTEGGLSKEQSHINRTPNRAQVTTQRKTTQQNRTQNTPPKPVRQQASSFSQPPKQSLQKPPASRTPVIKTSASRPGAPVTPITKGRSIGADPSTTPSTAPSTRLRRTKRHSKRPRTPITLDTLYGEEPETPLADRTNTPKRQRVGLAGYKSPADAVRAVRAIQQSKKVEPNLERKRRSCVECEEFIRAEAAGDPQRYEQMVGKVCKHKDKEEPQGYWNLTFEETQTQPPKQIPPR